MHAQVVVTAILAPAAKLDRIARAVSARPSGPRMTALRIEMWQLDGLAISRAAKENGTMV